MTRRINAGRSYLIEELMQNDKKNNAGRSYLIEPTCKKWQEESMQVDLI